MLKWVSLCMHMVGTFSDSSREPLRRAVKWPAACCYRAGTLHVNQRDTVPAGAPQIAAHTCMESLKDVTNAPPNDRPRLWRELVPLERRWSGEAQAVIMVIQLFYNLWLCPPLTNWSGACNVHAIAFTMKKNHYSATFHHALLQLSNMSWSNP